jgi:UDP-N-acetylglucosamine 2-epimerase (non-hydrolysing)/GDP/UDP-N,N'-diacetylbacillosamine 2-epimerase (hydrolysing)
MTGQKRKICVVTGSRADYGLLYWILRDLRDSAEVDLQLIATGMHLAPEFGLTYRVLEQDGFRIDARVEMLVSSDTPSGVAKSIGLGVIGFCDAYERLLPDIVVLLGDRFEIFAAAQAALISIIPIAHIAGGDTTEGAYDEAMRHSITKMSHVHFVTNVAAARRVCQLGEDPAHVHNFGSPGIDYVRRLKLLTRSELERDLGIAFRTRNLLVTFHPVTLSPGESDKHLNSLFSALDQLGEDVGLFFTHPNADTGGRRLMQMIDEYVAKRKNAKAFTSLGQLRYLSMMAQVDVVVGNSSSALYEAPSMRKPSVNIGDRQRGRLMADSVISCDADSESVVGAIQSAFEYDCSGTVNPYGDGHASERIAAVLKALPDPAALLKKRFYAYEPAHA